MLYQAPAVYNFVNEAEYYRKIKAMTGARAYAPGHRVPGARGGTTSRNSSKPFHAGSTGATPGRGA